MTSGPKSKLDPPDACRPLGPGPHRPKRTQEKIELYKHRTSTKAVFVMEKVENIIVYWPY